MQQVHKNIPIIKSRKFCSVPQCSSYCTGDISLHKFPISDPQLCKQWQDQLKIRKNITKNMVVCSKHFQMSDYTFENYTNVIAQKKRLKKGVVPSQNFPISSVDKNLKKETKTRRSRWIDQKEENEKTVDFSEEQNHGVFEENIDDLNQETKGNVDVLNQEKVIKEKEKPLICVPSAASIETVQSYYFVEDKAVQTDFDLFSDE